MQLLGLQIFIEIGDKRKFYTLLTDYIYYENIFRVILKVQSLTVF